MVTANSMSFSFSKHSLKDTAVSHCVDSLAFEFPTVGKQPLKSITIFQLDSLSLAILCTASYLEAIAWREWFVGFFTLKYRFVVASIPLPYVTCHKHILGDFIIVFRLISGCFGAASLYADWS